MLTLHYSDYCRYPGFGFGVECSVFPEHSIPLHTHEFAELVIVRHGHGRHLINDGEFLIEAGDVFVIRPSDCHGYENIQGLDLINIIFDPEQFVVSQHDLHRLTGFHMLFHLEPMYRDAHNYTSCLRLSNDALRRVYDFVEPMQQEYKRGEPGFECQVRAYFNLLAVFLSRMFSEQQTPGSQVLLRLSRVQTHLHACFNERVTLDQLADMASMSKNTLLRAFRKCYGSSPMSYLSRVRLAKACELLVNSTRSVTDIAQSVGFTDHSHFTRMFHRTYGRSPTAYRKGHKGLSE